MTPTGLDRDVVVPSPSCPPLFVPQQATAPDESDTQLCWPPAASPVEVAHSPSEENELLGNDPAQATMSDSQMPEETWKLASQAVATHGPYAAPFQRSTPLVAFLGRALTQTRWSSKQAPASTCRFGPQTVASHDPKRLPFQRSTPATAPMGSNPTQARVSLSQFPAAA